MSPFLFRCKFMLVILLIYSHFNKLVRVAIEDAIKNYKIIMNGGEIPEKMSAYRRIITKAENLLMAKK